MNDKSPLELNLTLEGVTIEEKLEEAEIKEKKDGKISKFLNKEGKILKEPQVNEHE